MSGLVLYTGRPESMENRMTKEIGVYDFLDSLGIPYQRVDHPAVETMEDCLEIDALLQATICKNLFLCNRQQTNFYLLMMADNKVFKTKELSKQIGTARLSFGSPEKMEEYLDITPGSVSVMGLMNDRDGHVQLLIDEDVLKGEYFGCHPCINTSSLRIRTKDLLEKFLPSVHHSPVIVHLVGEG